MTDAWPEGYWRVAPDSATAHLFAYASEGEDPNIPPCGQAIDKATTRPAMPDEPQCADCDRWFLHNGIIPHLG